MLRLSDFVTCRKRYYEWEGSISQFWKTVGRGNLENSLSDTNKQFFMMSRLSDFVVSSTNLHIWSSGFISKV